MKNSSKEKGKDNREVCHGIGVEFTKVAVKLFVKLVVVALHNKTIKKNQDQPEKNHRDSITRRVGNICDCLKEYHQGRNQDKQQQDRQENRRNDIRPANEPDERGVRAGRLEGGVRHLLQRLWAASLKAMGNKFEEAGRNRNPERVAIIQPRVAAQPLPRLSVKKAINPEGVEESFSPSVDSTLSGLQENENGDRYAIRSWLVHRAHGRRSLTRQQGKVNFHP
jgi:hypothetical protein